jgi:hypothetical protein
MRTTTHCLLLLGLAAGACQKETAEPAEPEDAYPFVPGELLVGITDGVPITKAFRLADSLNFTITRLNGFFYNSTLPKDSVDYVRSVLLRKSYLNKNGFSAGSIYSVYFNSDDAKIRITNSFFEGSYHAAAPARSPAHYHRQCAVESARGRREVLAY